MHLMQYTQTKQALGGDITIGFVADYDQNAADKLFVQLWHYVYTFERLFSRFLPSSELSILNRSAGVPMSISQEFKNLLTAAKSMAEMTDGLYNPFILPALQKSGYKKSVMPGYENDPVDDYSRRSVVAIDRLVIDGNRVTIPHDSALDMGGCGKGYLADRLRDIMNTAGVANYWMNLSGDIATAGHDQNAKSWAVDIQNSRDLQSVSDWSIACPIEPFAIATSGTFKRKGHSVDYDWHHIIDPITLKPAQTDIRLATICAPTTLQADVLASCAIILGSDKAPDWLRSHGVSDFLLQCEDATGVFEKQFGTAILKESMNTAGVGK